MENRIALIGIIVEDTAVSAEINRIQTERRNHQCRG